MPKGIYERKPKGAAAKAVVPIHDLIPASGARQVAGIRHKKLNGQAPITVQFGKIKITIEVDQ
jgi:hypothetical protein